MTGVAGVLRVDHDHLYLPPPRRLRPRKRIGTLPSAWFINYIITLCAILAIWATCVHLLYLSLYALHVSTYHTSRCMRCMCPPTIPLAVCAACVHLLYLSLYALHVSTYHTSRCMRCMCRPTIPLAVYVNGSVPSIPWPNWLDTP